MIRYKCEIGKNVYPNLEEGEIDSIQAALKKYEISIGFLFDDGLEFEYPCTYDIKDTPGDLSFFEKGVRILTVVISFGTIIFFDGNDKEIITVKTFDEYDF